MGHMAPMEETSGSSLHKRMVPIRAVSELSSVRGTRHEEDDVSLTFDALRDANLRRCEQVFHPLTSWTLTDWATAAAGELGEACNVIKKMRRWNGSHNDPIRNIDPASVEGQRALAHEIADTVIYLDLLAARAGIDLGAAVCEKFDLVSQRAGCSIVLSCACVTRWEGTDRLTDDTDCSSHGARRTT